MMNSIEKNIVLSQLFDYYKNLLTPKQREYFELYFFEDLTFQEISEEFGISKTAVHDSISKTISILNDFESKLNLRHKGNKLKELFEQWKKQEIDIEQLIMVIEGEI